MKHKRMWLLPSSGVMFQRYDLQGFVWELCRFFSELALVDWDTTTNTNSLKMLQNGLKHSETVKIKKGEQGKSVLFTEY